MFVRYRRGGSTWIRPLLAAGLLTTAAMPGPQSTDKPTISPELNLLERYIGAWTLTEHHYDVMGKVIATVKGTEEIAWVLDKHAIQRTYISKSDSRTFRAIGLLTWNAAEGKYYGTWLDNLSNGGPTNVKGDWDPKRSAMVFKNTVTTGTPVAREFSVIERFVDDSTRLATTFEVTGGAVQKRTEVEYKRTVPCPGKLRMLPDIGG